MNAAYFTDKRKVYPWLPGKSTLNRDEFLKIVVLCGNNTCHSAPAGVGLLG